MSEFEAVIFDLDGLLIDSERIYMRSWMDGAERVGYDLTLDFYLTCVGMPYQECLELVTTHFGPDFPVDDFLAASNEVRLDLLGDGMKIKPGAFELLDYLVERDLPRAIATSSRREYVTGHLRDLGLDGYFQALVTRNDVENGKPHPDPYLKAAKAIDAEPKRCLALEDSRHGIRSAAAAGMHVVMVPDLQEPDAELKKTCLAIAADLNEVKDMLAGA